MHPRILVPPRALLDMLAMMPSRDAAGALWDQYGIRRRGEEKARTGRKPPLTCGFVESG
jgi:hypothetical protein